MEPNEVKQVVPLTEDQVALFIDKLGAFRSSLAPHEQAALDAIMIRAGAAQTDADVQGFDGGGNQPGFAGDDYVSPPYRYAGPVYVYYAPTPGYQYAYPVWGQPYTFTQAYRNRYGVW